MSVIHDLDHTPISRTSTGTCCSSPAGRGSSSWCCRCSPPAGAHRDAVRLRGPRRAILPNFIRTARFIFQVAGTFLVVGTTALFVALLAAGFTPGRAFYHAINLFFASFDTGGFSPCRRR
jgi:trk system potassium uptake protein